MSNVSIGFVPLPGANRQVQTERPATETVPGHDGSAGTWTRRDRRRKKSDYEQSPTVAAIPVRSMPRQ